MAEFGRVKWPVWGNSVGVPQLSRKLDDQPEGNFAASTTGSFVPLTFRSVIENAAQCVEWLVW